MSIIPRSKVSTSRGALFLKKQYVIILFFGCILFVTSCENKNEHFTHEPHSLSVSDTITLELSHIPDGLAAEDYKWRRYFSSTHRRNNALTSDYWGL